jgi:ABC-type multidrug transport system fused ATPase/permease subunit
MADPIPVKLLLRGFGGQFSYIFWLNFFTAETLSDIFDMLEMWWLGYWAQQYLTSDPSKVSAALSVNLSFGGRFTDYLHSYLAIYSVLVLCVILTHTWGYLSFTIGSLRASRTIHARLVNSLISCTFRWLDVTPASRVIARCTQDIQAGMYLDFPRLLSVGLIVLPVDSEIPQNLFELRKQVYSILSA